MLSSGSLARPTEWPASGKRKFVAPLSVLLLFGLFCAIVGLASVGSDQLFGALLGFCSALLFFVVAEFLFLTRMRRRDRTSDLGTIEVEGKPGLEIRYSMAVFAVLALSVLCLAMIGSIVAVYFTATAAGSPGNLTGAIVCWLFVALVCVFLVQVVLGRRRRGNIVLSDRGIQQRGMSFVSELPWRSVAGVSASYNGRPEVLVIGCDDTSWERRALGRLWRVDKLPPVPMIEVDCLFFALDEALIYHLLRFYVENPQARSELGTDAAMDRVRRSAFA